ncbi:MAG: hypothetical protein COT28_20045, partial [Methylobacterium sp. CG08_land_8_20_14_0_20_71_15]
APRPEEALGLALGRLALLMRAARRLDALEPEQAAGVRAALGHPVSAEEIAARPGIADDWAVLAHAVQDEDKLTARTVWLVGRGTGALAQILDYGTPGSPLPPAPAPGQDFAGLLAFHPGDPPLRAVLREGRAGPSRGGSLPGATTIAAALDGFADALARAPWTERWPLRLAGVRFGRFAPEGALGVGDGTGSLILRAGPHLPALASVAAGRAVDLFGLYDGYGLEPLALVSDESLYAVPAQDDRPLLMRAA